MKYSNLLTRIEDQGQASLDDGHDFDGPYVGGLFLAAAAALRDLEDRLATDIKRKIGGDDRPAKAPKAPKPERTRAPRGIPACTQPPTEPGKKARHRFDDVTGFCACGVNKDGSVQSVIPGATAAA